MTDHPLTEDTAVEMWDASPCSEGYEFRGMLTVEQDATLYAMRAAFDMGREYERTNPDDDRPWEPLNGPVCVGDEVRQELNGVTTIAVVGRVGLRGPWAAAGGFIGTREHGTWYVRHPARRRGGAAGRAVRPHGCPATGGACRWCGPVDWS